MISKGKFLQNANFYLPFLQEYFSLFTFHSEGKLLYFILLSFITLPLILQYLPSDGSQPYTLLFFS